MKILVPTDFSENANNALEYAAALANATLAELVLLHVYTPAVTQYSVIASLMAEETAREKNEAFEKLQIIIKTLSHEYNSLNCLAMVAAGEVKDEIIVTAKESQVDMVVMGTLGASGFQKVLFGSNATFVIENATCPVLAVPQDAAFNIPQTILFATDYHDSDVENIPQLVAIAQAFQANIIVGHIVKDEEWDEAELLLLTKFSAQIAGITNYPKITYRIFSDNNPSMGIDALIADVKADLLALSTRKRTLFEKLYDHSITKKIAQYSSVPLLAFHIDSDGYEKK